MREDHLIEVLCSSQIRKLEKTTRRVILLDTVPLINKSGTFLFVLVVAFMAGIKINFAMRIFKAVKNLVLIFMLSFSTAKTLNFSTRKK